MLITKIEQDENFVYYLGEEQTKDYCYKYDLINNEMIGLKGEPIQNPPLVFYRAGKKIYYEYYDYNLFINFKRLYPIERKLVRKVYDSCLDSEYIDKIKKQLCEFDCYSPNARKAYIFFKDFRPYYLEQIKQDILSFEDIIYNFTQEKYKKVIIEKIEQNYIYDEEIDSVLRDEIWYYEYSIDEACKLYQFLYMGSTLGVRSGLENVYKIMVMDSRTNKKPIDEKTFPNIINDFKKSGKIDKEKLDSAKKWFWDYEARACDF